MTVPPTLTRRKSLQVLAGWAMTAAAQSATTADVNAAALALPATVHRGLDGGLHIQWWLRTSEWPVEVGITEHSVRCAGLLADYLHRMLTTELRGLRPFQSDELGHVSRIEGFSVPLYLRCASLTLLFGTFQGSNDWWVLELGADSVDGGQRHPRSEGLNPGELMELWALISVEQTIRTTLVSVDAANSLRSSAMESDF